MTTQTKDLILGMLLAPCCAIMHTGLQKSIYTALATHADRSSVVAAGVLFVMHTFQCGS